MPLRAAGTASSRVISRTMCRRSSTPSIISIGSGSKEIDHVFPAESHPFLPNPYGIVPFRFSAITATTHPACGSAPQKPPSESGWDRDDGLSPLHRLPILHGRLPIRVQKHELPRSPAVHPQDQSRFPDADQKVWWKSAISARRGSHGGFYPACVTACREKALLFGDLEDPNSDVRLILSKGLSLRRRPELGSGPQVYYLL